MKKGTNTKTNSTIASCSTKNVQKKAMIIGCCVWLSCYIPVTDTVPTQNCLSCLGRLWFILGIVVHLIRMTSGYATNSNSKILDH